MVNGSSKNMLAYVLLSLLVFEHGFIHIRFGIFEFFASLVLNFTRYLFSVNTIFLLMRNIRNECCILKKNISCKYFMFHEMILKLYFMKWLKDTFKYLKNDYSNFIAANFFLQGVNQKIRIVVVKPHLGEQGALENFEV